MAKVFVLQETEHDFAKAEAFGDVVFLSTARRDDFINIVNSDHNRNLMMHLRAGLRDYDEEADFLVITGSPYVTAAVFAILGRKGFRTLRFLRWDNRDMVYRPLELQLNKIGD